MNLEQLEKGKELVEIINVTEKGLSEINILLKGKRESKERHFDDGIYSLSIAKHGDGSGNNAKLYRYNGNEEVLLAIKATLEKQLDEFKALFEEL